MSSQNLSVLITGGAGFLGRHLAWALADRGLAVTVLDDLSNPSSPSAVEPLRQSGVTVVEDSVFVTEVLVPLVTQADVVVHFASVVGVEETITNPWATIRNLHGTQTLTDLLTPRQRVVFGSSADVYGMHSEIYGGKPMAEDDLVVFESGLVHRWVYPKVKALEENLVATSAARSVCVRVFNSFGPGMDNAKPKRVVPQFLRAIEERRPLRINGDGRQRRCLCDYRDTINGFLMAIDWAESVTPGTNLTVNIGNDQPVQVMELAETMVRLGVETGVLEEPLPILTYQTLYSQAFQDHWDRIPDLTRASQVLGYASHRGVEEGLRELIGSVKRLELAV